MSHTIAAQRIDVPPHYKVSGLPPALSKKVDSFFELYLARGFSIRTIRAYSFDLVIFYRFLKGKKKTLPLFSNIEFKTLIDFIHQEKSRNAAPSSINRRLNTIDILYRHCFNKLIPGTQAPNIDPTKIRRKRYLTMDSTLGIFPIYAKAGRTFRVRMPNRLVKALEPHEVNAFFETIHSHRDRSIVTLMLICGLRCSEVLGIKISDLNTLSQTLRVCGKGNKERVLPVPPGVLTIIEKYMECERPMQTKLSSNNEDIIFLVQKGPRRGMPMTIEGLRGIFRYKRVASGVTHANPHRFRHTFGRNMAASGMSLTALQRLLGHNDHRTTIKYINLTLADVYADFEKAQINIKSLYGESV